MTSRADRSSLLDLTVGEIIELLASRREPSSHADTWIDVRGKQWP